MSSLVPGDKPDRQGPFADGSAKFEDVVFRGQSYTVIPDPSPYVQARIILAIEEGRRAIIQDPQTPEFATRILLGIEPSNHGENPGYWFKRNFDSFAADVRSILESACSLRENDPQVDIFQRLVPNIQGLEMTSVNNLSISVAGVVIAESLLDRSLPRWRGDRSGSVFARLRADCRDDVASALISPRFGRGSEMDLHANKLVSMMLRHFLLSAGAQELLGEEGNLQMTVPKLTAPMKEAARIEWRP